MRKLHTAVRIGALGALFVLICAVYLVILVNVQITGQDYYDIIKEETTTRYVKIAAKRGEIYDTNGKALVINTQIYDISLEYGAMPKKADAFNAVILGVLSAIKESGGVYTPVEVTFPFTGSFPNYEKDEEFFKSATNKTKLPRCSAVSSWTNTQRRRRSSLFCARATGCPPTRRRPRPTPTFTMRRRWRPSCASALTWSTGSSAASSLTRWHATWTPSC